MFKAETPLRPRKDYAMLVIVFAMMAWVAYAGAVMLMYMLSTVAIAAGFALLGIWALVSAFPDWWKAQGASGYPWLPRYDPEPE